MQLQERKKRLREDKGGDRGSVAPTPLSSEKHNGSSTCFFFGKGKKKGRAGRERDVVWEERMEDPSPEKNDGGSCMSGGKKEGVLMWIQKGKGPLQGNNKRIMSPLSSGGVGRS